MTGDINAQVEHVVALINEMVSLTAESVTHAQTSSTDLDELVKTAGTMSELSGEVENVLQEFKSEFEKVKEETKKSPAWVHFGIGNIFRVFIGGIADGLLEEGVLDRGITCVETFDYDVVDKIYAPYDNLGLNVILHGDGTREYKVLGALAEAVKAQSSDAEQWNRLKEIFAAKSLQLVSFTITEKGYALQKACSS